MKKSLIRLIMSVLALSMLVGCQESKKVENKNKMKEVKTTDEKKDINQLITIKQVLNKEGIAPNGDKVKYTYEVPIINIDKPKAQKINDMFLDLEKDMEERISNGQNMALSISAKAFLNDEIISVVMEIRKGGPGGIHVSNYDMKNDKEISTKELLDKYKFDSQKLITEINRQVEINESKPKEEQDFIHIDYFVDTIMDYSSNYNSKKLEEIHNETKEEKERYVIENIDKIKAYINNDGKFVFIHRAELEDEEFVVE